ncbi:hypothetical protein B0H13DRAFT_1571256, partial [Mycena leptocephala]
PLLPPELERIIFELAAFVNPASMPSLLLVAPRVKIWIEPLLYETLIITPNNASHHTPRGLFVHRVS